MALDNAQFMSELSITDPPGTDPLSEGDDQIRTSKRTQQQSFPNVDAVVNLTSAQLNDAALQSEVNVFTEVNIFRKNIALQPLDTVSDIEYSWLDSVGVTLWAARKTNEASSNDLLMVRNDATGVLQNFPFILDFASGQILASSGTAAVPQYSFQSSPDMGMSRGGNALGLSVGGVNRLDLATTQASWGVPIWLTTGTAAAPALAFNAAPTMGIFRKGTTEYGFSANSSEQMSVTDRGVNMVNLPTGPGGGLVSGDLYVKQSQQFAPTELVVGMQP